MLFSKRETPEQLGRYVSKVGHALPGDAATEDYSSGEDENTSNETLKRRKRATLLVKSRQEYLASTIAKAGPAKNATITNRAEIDGRTGIAIHNSGNWGAEFIDRLRATMSWAAIRVDHKANENRKDALSGGVVRAPALVVTFDNHKVIARDLEASGYKANFAYGCGALLLAAVLMYWIYGHIYPYW